MISSQREICWLSWEKLASLDRWEEGLPNGAAAEGSGSQGWLGLKAESRGIDPGREGAG